MNERAKYIEADHELLKERDSVIFHVADPIFEDGTLVRKGNGRVRRDNPTHTLGFAKTVGNNIVMAYGVVRPGTTDTFSRREGKERVEERLTYLINRVENFDRPIQEADPTILSNIVPQRVLHNLDHYINRVSKYYKLTGEELMFLRGDKRCNRCISVPLFSEEITEEEEVVEETVEHEAKDYIFCTRVVGDGDNQRVEVVINRTIDFLENGISLQNDDKMIDDLDELVNSNELYPEDEQACILYHDSISEDDMRDILVQYGFTYSTNLENSYSEAVER